MVKETNERLTITIKKLSYDFLDCLSQDTGMTKSKIMQKLLFKITLHYWSNPIEFTEAWRNAYGNTKK